MPPPDCSPKNIDRRLAPERETNLIGDIEGTEVELLREESDLMKRYVATIIIEQYSDGEGSDDQIETVTRAGHEGFRSHGFYRDGISK